MTASGTLQRTNELARVEQQVATSTAAAAAAYHDTHANMEVDSQQQQQPKELEATAAAVGEEKTTLVDDTATTNQYKNDANRDDTADKIDENDDDVDNDILQAFSLRFRFSEHTFASVWKALRDCGWKYNSKTGGYRSPLESREFATAQDVLHYLDHADSEACLPVITSNLQYEEPARGTSSSSSRSSRGTKNDEDEEESKQARAMRRRVLRCLNRPGSITSNEAAAAPINDDLDQASIQNNNHAPDDVESNRRYSSRLRDGSQTTDHHPQYAHHASVTMTEKGTNLYLHKNTQKAKRQTKASLAQAQQQLEDSLIAAPPPPSSLAECADFAQTNYQSWQQQQDEYLASIYPSHQLERWRFLLSTNHSLLFYGSGSKYHLLNRLAHQELDQEGYVLVMDGFDLDVTIMGILDLLVQLFLNGREPPPSRSSMEEEEEEVHASSRLTPSDQDNNHVIQRAINIARAMAKWAANDSLTPIFLVIHNLDGHGLRTPLAQDALAALVVHSTVPNGIQAIRLVASVDHVDASSALWSVATAANFAWIWQQVHTHCPYSRAELVGLLQDQEAHKEKTAKRHAREATMAQRAIEVLNTIAPRHKEVVQILARMQLQQQSKVSRGEGSGGGGGHKNGNKQTGEWVDYALLRSECKARCVINKHAQLNDFVTELEDHGIISFKRDKSTELVRIPLDHAKLHEILNCDNNLDGLRSQNL